MLCGHLAVEDTLKEITAYIADEDDDRTVEKGILKLWSHPAAPGTDE